MMMMMMMQLLLLLVHSYSHLVVMMIMLTLTMNKMMIVLIMMVTNVDRAIVVSKKVPKKQQRQQQQHQEQVETKTAMSGCNNRLFMITRFKKTMMFILLLVSVLNLHYLVFNDISLLSSQTNKTINSSDGSNKTRENVSVNLALQAKVDFEALQQVDL